MGMGVTITRMVRCDGGRPLKAYCDVVVGDLLIKGIRIIEGRRGPFVSMPRQQTQSGKWHDSVVLLTKEARAELSRALLEAFREQCATTLTRREDPMRQTLLSVLVALYGWLVSASVVWAQVPPLIRYQGQAVDSQGVPLEGPHTLTFRLYDAATGGTKVWEETQPDIPITKGHFSVLLGSVTPLTRMDWSRPRWLSLQVNSEPELAPRQPITSVPLALRAEVAERLANPVTTSTITDDAHRLMPSGAILLFDAACPSGYTRVSVLDGKFIVGDSTYNAAAGGSNTHTHGAGSYAGPSHAHDLGNHTHTVGQTAESGVGFIWPNDKHFTSSTPSTNTSGTSGTGAITGTSASTDSRPAYATVILCKKN